MESNQTESCYDCLQLKWMCPMMHQILTNNGILVFVLQVTNGDKVTLHHGNITAVLAGDDGGLPVERHLIVVFHRCVLLVGNFQGPFGEVVDLVHTDA